MQHFPSFARGERARRIELTVAALVSGVLLGWLLLRPIHDFVAWYEHEVNAPSVWSYVWSELSGSFQGRKPVKTLFYAGVGTLISLLAAAFYSSLHARNHRIDELTAELGRDLDVLIEAGESDSLEFKSTLRWDLNEQRTNRALEVVIMKALAGFLNGRGGTLLIGVADDGAIVGLEHDYRTLRKPNRDGFEQALITAVASHLGGDLCPYLQVVFHVVQGQDVCRVIILPAPRAVFIEQSGTPRLFLRSAATTRELNIKEALDYQAVRWPS
jgi:hypothetical protein